MTSPETQPDSRIYLKAQTIGGLAHESLRKYPSGTIFGTTSRGVFIRMEGKFLGFISYEEFRGPLTINVPLSGGFPLPLEIGSSFQITANQINFQQAGCMISIKNPAVWRPPDPSMNALPASRRHERLISTADYLLSKRANSDSVRLLAELLDLSNPIILSSPSRLTHSTDIHRLKNANTISDQLVTTASMSRWLGSGPGLTPSGDDLVLGVLLALNRWKSVLCREQNLNLLNLEIVEAAYRKTTTLSANLIECASLGLADERLIRVLDGLMSEQQGSQAQIDEMLDWGDSSGMDVFVGFAIALLAGENHP